MNGFFFKRIAVWLLIIAIIIAVAACSKPAQSDVTPAPTEGNSTEPNEKPASTPDAEETPPPENTDRWGKYDPPIDMVQVFGIHSNIKFHEGEDIYNNVWTRSYLEDLGIKLTYEWVVDASEFGEKMNLAITSGDLPDVFTVNPTQYKMLSDEGLIWDMTDIFEQYASENTKDVMTQDPIGYKSMHIDGRLMGLAYTDSSPGTCSLLWIRKDWLDKLGIPEPENMNDVLEIAEAFVRVDPDGNGEDDTYAFAFTGSARSFYPFMNAFHAYPSIWVLQDNGKLAHGSIQPEMKAALAKLQDMYKSGLIDPEFAVKDPGEDIVNGKIGMTYHAWWGIFANLPYTRVNNPEADWKAYPPMSIDEGIGKTQYSNAVGSYHVVNKNYQYPEAAVKMYNYWFDIIRNQTKENLERYLADPENPDIVYYHYINLIGWEPFSTVSDQLWAALESGDPTGLPYNAVATYDLIMKYHEDNSYIEGWATHRGNGLGGSESILRMVGNDRGVFNQFYGIPTPTMAEKMPALDAMMEEMILDIVLGAPLDNFDRYVEDWKRLGGDDITSEVNEWYQRNK